MKKIVVLLLFVSVQLQAQLGGVGLQGQGMSLGMFTIGLQAPAAVWSPLSLSPRVWVTDDLLVYKSVTTDTARVEGAYAGYWGDQSGSGNNYTQSDATKRPLWSAATGLTFDGSNDWLSSAVTLTQPNWIFIVSNYLKLGTLQATLDGGSPRQIFRLNGSYYQLDATTAIQSTGNDSVKVNTVYMYLLVFNGATSSVNRNGVSLVAGACGNNGLGGMYIGAGGSGGSSFGNVQIRALIAGNGTLTAAEITNMQTWLNSWHTRVHGTPVY